MCQPGRPVPQGESQDGSPGLARFHSTKSSGSRLCLVDLDARAGAQVRELLAGQLAVVREASRRNRSTSPLAPTYALPLATSVAIIATISGMNAVARGSWSGRQHAEGGEVLVHRVDVARGQRLDRLALLARALDDLVVHVGDVPHVVHPVAARPEPAAHDVEGDLRARVARRGCGRRPSCRRRTCRPSPATSGSKRLLAAGHRVVDLEHRRQPQWSLAAAPARRARTRAGGNRRQRALRVPVRRAGRSGRSAAA